MNLVRDEVSELAGSSSFSPSSRSIMDRAARRHFRHEPHSHDNAKIVSNSGGRMSLQRLTFDSAVAPLLKKPTAPFDKTERKRAHTSALYYSECFLRGIQPVDADTAAMEAQGKYERWWIKSLANHPVPSSSSSSNNETSTLNQQRSSFQSTKNQRSPEDHHVSKWRKTAVDDDDKIDEASAASANVVSVASGKVDSSSSLSTCRVAKSSMNMQNATFSPHDSRDPQEDDDQDEHGPVKISQISTLTATTKSQIDAVKDRLICDLKTSGGNVETSEFLGCLEFLEAFYRSKSWDGRGSCNKLSPFSLEGNWLTLSKPTYNECKGKSERGEYLYSLGRMSFDMFKPTNLVCSMQASFNHVSTEKKRREENTLDNNESSKYL